MKNTVRLAFRLACVGMLLALANGCATVRAYEREHLVDPIMSFEADALTEGRESKWMEAREGSTGSTTGAGGGCACK